MALTNTLHFLHYLGTQGLYFAMFFFKSKLLVKCMNRFSFLNFYYNFFFPVILSCAKGKLWLNCHQRVFLSVFFFFFFFVLLIPVQWKLMRWQRNCWKGYPEGALSELLNRHHRAGHFLNSLKHFKPLLYSPV